MFLLTSPIIRHSLPPAPALPLHYFRHGFFPVTSNDHTSISRTRVPDREHKDRYPRFEVPPTEHRQFLVDPYIALLVAARFKQVLELGVRPTARDWRKCNWASSVCCSEEGDNRYSHCSVSSIGIVEVPGAYITKTSKLSQHIRDLDALAVSDHERHPDTSISTLR